MASSITIKDYKNNAIRVKELLPDTINDALFQNQSKIISLNQEQLYDGKAVDGNDIHPLYSEDSFFKTQTQAQGYIKWKQKITPNSSRNPDSPNLMINGYFYRSLKLILDAGNVFIVSLSAGSIGETISTKYKNIFGLNKVNQEKVNNEIIYPSIKRLIEKYL
jgi:hypothetical protein